MLPSLRRTDPSKGLQRAPLRSQHRPYQQRQEEKIQAERSLWLPPVSWGVPGRPPHRDDLPRRQMALRRGARPARGRMCCGSRDLPRSVDQRSVALWAAVTIYRDACDWPTVIHTACVKILSRAWARRPFLGRVVLAIRRCQGRPRSPPAATGWRTRQRPRSPRPSRDTSPGRRSLRQSTPNSRS